MYSQSEIIDKFAVDHDTPDPIRTKAISNTN